MSSRGAWFRGRPALAAVVIYGVLSLVMFAPGLAPGRTLSASDFLFSAAPWASERPAEIEAGGSNPIQSDSPKLFVPFLDYTRATLPHVPLWNPYIMAGRPYLANASSAVFSIFSVPAYVLPFWRSLALIAALKLFVAALGTFLLARELGMRFPGALTAGLAFAFSLWMVAWTPWPESSVFAFLPWLWLTTEHLIRRPGRVPFVALATVVALQHFAGYPGSSFHVLVATVVYGALRLALIRPPARAAAGRLLVLAGALIAGTALAAVAVLPFVELLRLSDDSFWRSLPNSPIPRHQPARYLGSVFLADYWGLPDQERSYYAGALTLMLAAAGLVLRPRRERVALALLGALAVAATVGIPPVSTLLDALPLFDISQNGRLAVVFVLCLALLAGWGLDDLVGRRPPVPRPRALGALCISIAVVPVVYAIVADGVGLSRFGSALDLAWASTGVPWDPEVSGSSGDDVIRLASLLEWLPLAAAAMAILVLRLRGRLSGAAFSALAVALIAADLFKAGMGVTPAIPVSHADPPTTPAIHYLQDQRPARFVGVFPEGGYYVNPLPPNVAMRYGLYDARGFDAPIETRFDRFWLQAASPRLCYYYLCTSAALATAPALHALSLLGVSHLVQDPQDRLLREPGLRVAYSGPDARIYSNRAALPRTFLVDRQTVVADDDRALAAVAAPGFDARALVITHERIPGLALDSTQAGPVGRATITEYHAEHVGVRTDSGRDALLVLSDSHYPGWTATVDGRPAAVHRVDYFLRGVSVPAGSHEVEFRYAPTSWRAGAVITAGTFLLLVGLLVVPRRRWSRRPSAPGR